MSTKILRSLIHERFPFELRVELELLSKRRDIGNREKQEELILLLRKWHIDDIVMLGSGTNRYAFKLDGFVVKFATDRDGKIDNWKEFKMAKRLYPYVIKVHEVSENGTILVCEYIQPFDSFTEMMHHSDEIKEILAKLSDSYLIGDVGLSERNYSNWGVRIGTNKPVCLDFAYVYSVAGSLFTCGYCKNHSVLLPSKDYTRLYCSNPACRKEYKFEDIRSKIGNEAHQHEIGDLSQEGYLMSDTNLNVELTPERSGYLNNRKEKKLKKEKEDIPEIEFVIEKSPKEYMEGSNGEMDDRIKNFGKRFDLDPEKFPVAEVISASPEEVEEAMYVLPMDEVIEESEVEEKHIRIDMEHPVERFNMNIELEDDAPMSNLERMMKEDEEVCEALAAERKLAERALNLDVSNLGQNISKCSNAIKAYLMNRDLFDAIKEHILDDKMLPNHFYQIVQNCIYHTVREFCNVITTPDDIAEFRTPEVTSFHAPTVDFINSIIAEKEESATDTSLIDIVANRKMNDPSIGIQEEWLNLLKDRMKIKFEKIKGALQVHYDGIDAICECIKEGWCSKSEEVASVEKECQCENCTCHENEFVMEMDHTPDMEEIEKAITEADDDEHEDHQHPTPLTVDIDESGIDGYDVITISNNSDTVLKNSIPFIINLAELSEESSQNIIPSVADDRNGVWDWLIHVAHPMFAFFTATPEKYLALNSDMNRPSFKACILEKNESIGKYFIGVYLIDEDLGRVEEGDEGLVREINYLVKKYIANTKMSLYPLMNAENIEEANECEVEAIFFDTPIEENSEEDEASAFAADVMKSLLENAAEEEDAEEELEEMDQYADLDDENPPADEFAFKVRYKKKPEDF